jgi:phage head maturation protease
LNQVITATVLHSDVKVGTTWDRGLRVWQDSCGLGFELDVPITQKGRALRDMIADGGINQTSVGLITLESTDSLDCQRRRKNVPDGGVKVYQSG